MKSKVNIDSFKVWGNYPQNLTQRLRKAKKENVWNYEGYSLTVTKTDGAAMSKTNTTATFAINLSDQTEVGEFTMKNTHNNPRYWCFEAKNEFLYSMQLYKGVSAFGLIPIIFDGLRLNVRGVNVDVAYDTNVNNGLRIRKAMKDCETFNLIVNGKDVGDTEKIEGVGRYYAVSRKKLLSAPTDYYSNAHGLTLRSYDKQKEIEQSGKDYISAFNGWAGKCWRTEISTKNQDVRDWISFSQASEDSTLYTSDITHFVHLLGEEKYRLKFWRWQSSRLVRFTRKRDRKHIDLYDVISGNI